MNNADIKILIDLESLHRKVFDTIYVQGHDLTKDDKITLYRYNILYEKYPRFRYDLAEVFISLLESESPLSEDEIKILEALGKVNFSRYSISNEAKNKIKELRKIRKDELEN